MFHKQARLLPYDIVRIWSIEARVQLWKIFVMKINRMVVQFCTKLLSLLKLLSHIRFMLTWFDLL